MKITRQQKPERRRQVSFHQPKAASSRRDPAWAFSSAFSSTLMLAIILLLSASSVMAANLLSNPGFESGQIGWSGIVRGGSAIVVADPAGAHSGNNYISNYNGGGWSSASQGDYRAAWSTGVTNPVSGAKFYKLSAWVKVPGALVTPRDITLRYRFEPSGARVDVGQQTIATENWTLLESGWISPNAGDTYLGYWEVHSTANGVVFYADDCVFEEHDGGEISGVVKDDSSNAVVGATVQLKLANVVYRTTTSTSGGVYTFHVPPVAGTAYTVNASKMNYSSPADVDVTSPAPPTVATAGDIVLTALPTVIVSGGVTNGANNQAIAGATVKILGDAGSLTTTTGADGIYSFTVAANLPYYVSAKKFPLTAPSQYILPSADQTVNFTMDSAMLVGLYAENVALGSLGVWSNAGTLGGSFVPVNGPTPVAGQVTVLKAVTFNNTPMILSNTVASALVTAPAEITGSTANYTVNAWLFDPDTLPSEQTYISWAKRGGPNGSNLQLGYGTNPSYGAVGHWGAPDMGYTTPPSGGAWHNIIVTWDSGSGIESIYIDGVLSKSSPVKSLDIGAGLPIVLGSGYWEDFNAPYGVGTDIPLVASVARLEVYGIPATAAEVASLATITPPVQPTGTIQGNVVTTDSSSPTNFTVLAKNPSGTTVAIAVTGNSGAYSFTLPPGTYTVLALKTNYVTLPGPQTNSLAAGQTVVVPDFTAVRTTVSGKVVDVGTGAPIYNAVVQVGGAGQNAVITDQTGSFSLLAIGCGGVEVFADALNYHCRSLLLTNIGAAILSKTIALTNEVETGGVTNGGFEIATGGVPDSWIQGWEPTNPPPITEFWTTNVPYSGTNSVFVTGAAAFEPLSQFTPTDPASVYNCYFKARGTNLASAGGVWFPMFAFRDAGFGEIKGWISGEPAPYYGWTHNAPTNWMQYLLAHNYSGDDAIQPFVRIAPPAGAAWLSATFCFTGAALTSDQGVFVDDVVMDKVPASVPSEVTVSDAPLITINKVGSGVLLTWPMGTLLESPTVTGPWTTNSATSPYTNSSPIGTMFYKLIVQ